MLKHRQLISLETFVWYLSVRRKTNNAPEKIGGNYGGKRAYFAPYMGTPICGCVSGGAKWKATTVSQRWN